MNTGLLRHAVATALTVYGIETTQELFSSRSRLLVATALTVYGIETFLKVGAQDCKSVFSCNSTYRLRY